MERPEYVPHQIWEAATYLLGGWAEDGTPVGDAFKANLHRLLFDNRHQAYARDLEKPWDRIVSSIEELNRRARDAWADSMIDSEYSKEPPDAAEPYRLLLDLLATLPEAMDEEMRPALDEVQQRLANIAEDARRLATEWENMTELRERKGIEWTSERQIISDWAAAHHCSIEGKHWRDFPDLADLIERVAAAAESVPLRPPIGYEYALVGNGGTAGTHDVSAVVRKFDSALSFSMVRDLKISDNDLALFLSALLRREVARHTVLQARKRSHSEQE